MDQGETQSVEKMKPRIDYDLDYLRNWSLRFGTKVRVAHGGRAFTGRSRSPPTASSP
jgi:lipopolysaccharide/colanic/teichoic acid biosynthesis glycosyltransferase